MMKFTLAVASLFTYGQAHILMMKPPSDKYNNRNDIPESQKDVNLNAPMTPDRIGNLCGTVEKIVSSDEYAAGTYLPVELQGEAVHGGRHCQFGFSYDRNAFAVTHKVFGNCVSGSKSYSIPIPSSAPSGPVTFFWAWFNREGNREMYMNCGEITLTGGTGSKISGKEILVTNIGEGEAKFPEGFADDFGKDLFEAQPNIDVSPSGSYDPGQNTQDSNKTNSFNPSEIQDANPKSNDTKRPTPSSPQQNNPQKPNVQDNHPQQPSQTQIPKAPGSVQQPNTVTNDQGQVQQPDPQENLQNDYPQPASPGNVQQPNAHNDYQQQPNIPQQPPVPGSVQQPNPQDIEPGYFHPPNPQDIPQQENPQNDSQWPGMTENGQHLNDQGVYHQQPNIPQQPPVSGSVQQPFAQTNDQGQYQQPHPQNIPQLEYNPALGFM